MSCLVLSYLFGGVADGVGRVGEISDGLGLNFTPTLAGAGVVHVNVLLTL